MIYGVLYCPYLNNQDEIRNTHLITSEGEEGFAIGLWNIFVDEILNPVIELDREYTKAEFVNCSGKLIGNKIELSEIPPFGFVFINLK